MTSRWPRWAPSLALGQLIALLIAATGVFSTVLVNERVNVPTAQSSLNYVLLCCSFLGWRAWRGGGWRAALTLRVPWWHYALLALADVEANFLVVKAYQYTSITSIMLIDSWTIPCVMALSYVFLGRRYSRWHAAGVALCVAGLAVLVLSDYLDARAAAAADGGGGGGGGGGADAAASSAVLGDLLCVAAATLYAVSNVGQEVLVKRHDRVEYLGMLGAFGVLVNTAQLLLLERSELATLVWSPTALGALAGFALALFAMYAATAVFLQSADATLFNLSLLTSDVWAILAAVLLFGATLRALYFVALAFIVAGLLAYNAAGDAALPFGDAEGAEAPGASALVAAEAAAAAAAAAAALPPTALSGGSDSVRASPEASAAGGALFSQGASSSFAGEAAEDALARPVAPPGLQRASSGEAGYYQSLQFGGAGGAAAAPR